MRQFDGCPLCGNMYGGPIEVERPDADMRNCALCQITYAQTRREGAFEYEAAYAQGHGDVGGSFNSALRLPVLDGAYDYADHFLIQAQREVLDDLVARPRENSNLLDIGAGPGWFAAAAQAREWTAEVADLAPTAVHVVEGHGILGHVIKSPGFPPDLGDRFSVVTMFEVVEHLPDPVGYLTQVRENFPSARLYVSVPSPISWSLIAGRTEQDYPPNHFTRWTRESLEELLRRAGYAHVEVRDRLPVTAAEMACVSLRWFLRGVTRRTATPSLSAAPPTQPDPPTYQDLEQELQRRQRIRRVLAPAAALLGVRRSAMSMLGVGE